MTDLTIGVAMEVLGSEYYGGILGVSRMLPANAALD
jgi:hypothetical protein